jgi:hypothetical protein
MPYTSLNSVRLPAMGLAPSARESSATAWWWLKKSPPLSTSIYSEDRVEGADWQVIELYISHRISQIQEQHRPKDLDKKTRISEICSRRSPN